MVSAEPPPWLSLFFPQVVLKVERSLPFPEFASVATQPRFDLRNVPHHLEDRSRLLGVPGAQYARDAPEEHRSHDVCSEFNRLAPAFSSDFLQELLQLAFAAAKRRRQRRDRQIPVVADHLSLHMLDNELAEIAFLVPGGSLVGEPLPLRERGLVRDALWPWSSGEPGSALMRAAPTATGTCRGLSPAAGMCFLAHISYSLSYPQDNGALRVAESAATLGRSTDCMPMQLRIKSAPKEHARWQRRSALTACNCHDRCNRRNRTTPTPTTATRATGARPPQAITQ